MFGANSLEASTCPDHPAAQPGVPQFQVLLASGLSCSRVVELPLTGANDKTNT